MTILNDDGTEKNKLENQHNENKATTKEEWLMINDEDAREEDGEGPCWNQTY
jgi:hypothetical protein